MLIILGGLPGTGKTTLARRLARSVRALHLRIDTIEQALLEAEPEPGSRPARFVGPAGYLVAYEVARDNLLLGLTVVADSVNPLPVTRAAWRAVATDAGVPAVEIELICSDPVEHRRRVESRAATGGRNALSSWREVVDRDYAEWDRERVVIDTARLSVEQALAELGSRLSTIRSS